MTKGHHLRCNCSVGRRFLIGENAQCRNACAESVESRLPPTGGRVPLKRALCYNPVLSHRRLMHYSGGEIRQAATQQLSSLEEDAVVRRLSRLFQSCSLISDDFCDLNDAVRLLSRTLSFFQADRVQRSHSVRTLQVPDKKFISLYYH